MTEGQSETYNLLHEAANSGALDFALESSKAVVKTTGAGSSPRPEGPPERRIEEFRRIYNSDPLVGQAVDKMVEYLVGSGFNIEPRNVPYTDTEQTQEDIADLKRLIELSDFNGQLIDWVRRAVIDGTAFLELVWNSETDTFEPNILPALDMEIEPDEFGNDGKYILDKSDGEVEYAPHEVAVLRFHRKPKEMWGHSFIQRAQEQADMLRDMEIDMARFISTKAYPPILWKLGDADNNIHWTDEQIEGWLDTVEQIEPDSMLAAGDDVDYEVVGSTSTSSQSGVMNLDGTFTHLQTRVATSFGIPAFLLNLDAGTGRNDSVTQMPSFDRKIKALRVPIQNAVEQQIFRSIMGHPDPENYTDMLPRFEFGEHSSEEERLDTDEAIKLFNQGFLTREAFAERVGIDPEVEMPSMDELESDIIPIIQQLAGSGDDIQNPDGGSPTDTGGGAESSGGEAKTRQNPENDNSGDDSRNGKSVDEE